MATSDPGEREVSAQSEAAARERRLAALRELAGERLHTGVTDASQRAISAPTTTPSAPSSAPSSPGASVAAAKRGRGAWVWSVALVVVAIAVIAGVVVRYSPTLLARFAGKAGQPAIVTRTISPQNENISCLIGTAWSPQGDRVALLGYQGVCPQFDFSNTSTASTGSVTVYDVATGEIKAQFQPDSIITRAMPPVSAQTQQSIVYGGISWSANEQTLALPFVIVAVNPFDFSTSATQVGLLLINLSGNQNRVFYHSYQMVETLDTTSAQTAGGFEWDTHTGNIIGHNLEQPGAVAYRWGALGKLIPLKQAPSMAIGNPVGGQTFSIWQPGEAQIGLAQPNPANPTALMPIPDLYLWLSSFGAWSPDGRYFYAPAVMFTNVALPGANAPDPGLLKKNGYGSLATVAPHDSALTGFYSSSLQQVSFEEQNGLLTPPGAYVAWSPDGRVMAARPQLPGDNASLFTVTLYNSATGAPLMTLRHDMKLAAASTGAFASLNWSPDGKRLALIDNTFDTLTIWTFNKSLV